LDFNSRSSLKARIDGFLVMRFLTQSCVNPESIKNQMACLAVEVDLVLTKVGLILRIPESSDRHNPHSLSKKSEMRHVFSAIG